MASQHYFLAGEGALWAQPHGPNTEPIYLGCHTLGDIDRPRGDSEPIWCQDESGPNRFKIVGTVQGAPGLVTTTITAKMTDELDQLEKIKGGFTLFVMMSKAGRKDIFANFDRVFVLGGARVTNEGISGLVVSSPEDNANVEQTFDVSAESLLRLADFDVNRQSISETSHITDLSFLGEDRQRTDESVAIDASDIGYASTAAPTGSPGTTANVLYTVNGGAWNAMAADPFGSTEDISGVESFYIGRDTIRVVVVRGTADGANPLEIAYTDDNGATWVTVNVGAVVGQYATTRFSLFALNYRNLWVGTQNGYIYKSGDSGGTWAAQQSGTITSGAINCIRFVDQNVGWFAGAANAIGRTLDGGDSWGAISGPSAQSAVAINVVEPLDRNRAWIAYADGTAWYTLDGGLTWAQRTTFSGSGIGSVRDLRFLNEELGYLARNTTAPVGHILWTPDGGFSWLETTLPPNSGINVVEPIDEWTFYVAGQTNTATGFIAKGIA